MEPLLVRACRRDDVERTPVWFMRQAGRSLPEYRRLRESHGFFDIAETPDLCAEVTLQPVHRHDVDAAVLFADIVTPVIGMGAPIELVEGVGPVIDPPLRSTAEIAKLRVPQPEEAFAPVLEAIGIVRAALPEEKALVGFCGGPFTVACYLVEGRGSRDFLNAKALMLREPATWHALLERLTETFGAYVAAQASAGADAIQLFDSWAGILSPRDYEEFAAPYAQRVLAAAGVPTIHFGTGTGGLLSHMREAGGDVIGLDWRVDLDRGVGGSRPRPRRPGQPRPGDAAWTLGAHRRRRAGRPRPRSGPPGAHLQPRPRCAAGNGSRRAHPLDGVRQGANDVTGQSGGRPDGVRQPGHACGRSGVLRGHPRRPADQLPIGSTS